ncbi:hypothetical protein QE390_004964 [Siphonobacter sp. SORGH_AS 1065]|nr:hypothetical protein [Siphonobacter sp. SORGH_AS_1065]
MKKLVLSLCLLWAFGNASAQVSASASPMPKNFCNEFVRTVASGYIKLADFQIFDQDQNPIYLTIRKNKNEYIWYLKLPALGCIKSTDKAYFVFEGGSQYSLKMMDKMDCKGNVSYDLSERENQPILVAFLTKRLTQYRLYSEHQSFVSVIPQQTADNILGVFKCMGW